MTTEKTTPIQWKVPEAPTPAGMGAVTRSFASMLAKTQTPTWEEKKLGEMVRQDLAKQVGTMLKAEHGEHLANKLSLNTLTRMDEYVAQERAIRERERHPDDQADIDGFSRIIREATGNSLLAIRQAAVNQIETIVITPLEVPEEKTDEVIITQQPGFLQRFFGGGPQVTRMRR